MDLVGQIDTNVILSQSTYGFDSENKIIQPIELVEYNKSLVALKQLFITDKVSNETKFNLDYPKYIKLCTDKRAELKATLIKKSDLLANIATKETQLKAKIAELKDRKLLNTKINEVKKSKKDHE